MKTCLLAILLVALRLPVAQGAPEQQACAGVPSTALASNTNTATYFLDAGLVEPRGTNQLPGMEGVAKDGTLCYEYNMFEIERAKLRAEGRLPVGKVPITVPGWFTGNDYLDLGSDLGSPVSSDYFDQATFPFSDTLGTTAIRHLKRQESQR